MKKCRNIFMLILVAAMLFLLPASSVSAAENYTYTITFYAGNRGVFTSQDGLVVESENAVVTMTEDKIVITGLQAGEKVGLTAPASVTLDADSKYYVQGFRLSGRDNDTVADSVFNVEDDDDFVVAYGIKGNQVSYTVNYQDEDGNSLAPSDVYYGNIGDKPVVAYRYIDGYVPRYLGLTKTLSQNEAENVFTFIYDEKPTFVIDRPDDDNDNRPNTGDNDTDRPDNQDGNNEVDDSNGPGGQNGENNPQGETPGNQGGDDVIIDLDEEEVPLGGPDGTLFDKIPMAVYVGMGVVSIIALIVLFILSRKMKAGGKE